MTKLPIFTPDTVRSLLTSRRKWERLLDVVAKNAASKELCQSAEVSRVEEGVNFWGIPQGLSQWQGSSWNGQAPCSIIRALEKHPGEVQDNLAAIWMSQAGLRTPQKMVVRSVPL